MHASSLRRNTYVVEGPVPSTQIIKTEMDLSRVERQNLMRLKINRIALVQELKMDTILPILQEKGVITAADKQNILTGSTHQDRARILIDILPGKKKEIGWYKHFRDTLLNPHGGTEVKKRYRLLVEFLDNTFIPQPTSTPIKVSAVDSHLDDLKFPKYGTLPEISGKDANLENITPETTTKNSTNVVKTEDRIQDILVLDKDVHNSVEENDEIEKFTKDDTPENEDKLSWSSNSKDSMILVKGMVHQWVPKPENSTSNLKIPEKLLNILEESNSFEDKDQINYENMILEKMRKLELTAELKKEAQLPLGFEICMSEALIEILNEPQYFHCYVKYFLLMQGLPSDIISSYSSVLQTIATDQANDITDQVIKHGFTLSNFFQEMSLFASAEEVLTLLLNFLNTDTNIDTWMNKYMALVKLTQVRNKDYNFSGAEQSYFWAVQMSWPIQLMSFGKDLIDEGDLLTEMSYYQIEQGALSAGYGWAKRSLQELSPGNHTGIINALCNGVMAYSSKLQVKKARDLALQAVLQSKMFFGENHPMYLKALLHLCHFTSEFIHEEITVQIAQKALKLAWKMYGCECLQVALAHRAVAKSLMVLHRFNTEEYYEESMESIRIARSIFPDQHPILHIFLHTFASALQWKALNSPKDVYDSTLYWAETEANQALTIVKSCYGEISLRKSQMYSLLGQIYSKMTRSEEAEVYLNKCVTDMKLCQSPNSHYYLLSLATLGIFYKLLSRPKEAIVLLKQVVTHIDTHGFYIWWIHVSYQHLMACYNELDDVTSVKNIQQKLDTWLEENPQEKGLVTLDDIEQSAKPYEEFLVKFDIWGTKLKHVKDQLIDAKTLLDKEQ